MNTKQLIEKLEKLTGKHINLKEAIINDARYEKLPENDKIQVQTALHGIGMLQTFNEPVTTQKIDFLIKRLKQNMSKYSPKSQITVGRILTTLDPQDWKQHKPEPVVRDFQLNSVMIECNVCGAGQLIDGGILKTTTSDGSVYEIKGTAEEAEFKPGHFQLRVNNGPWSKVYHTKDLAGEVGRGGFDIKPEFKGEKATKWLQSHV